jgi:hypothetical protein
MQQYNKRLSALENTTSSKQQPAAAATTAAPGLKQTKYSIHNKNPSALGNITSAVTNLTNHHVKYSNK